MFRPTLLIVVFALIFSSCSDQKTADSIEPEPGILVGTWDAGLSFTDESGLDRVISFKLQFDTVPGPEGKMVLKANVRNDIESIPQDIEWITGDSLRIKSRFFDSWLDIAVKADTLEGMWVNPYRSDDYTMPFLATKETHENVRDLKYRIPVNGRWTVVFSPASDDPDTAVGVFKTTKDNRTGGTFMTTTGDYRFLYGDWQGNELQLSTFDGSHAYLFTAKYKNRDTLTGIHYSGNHWQTDWIAWRNDSAELADPYSLTSILDPDSALNFAFTDLNGKTISLNDETYHSKPVVIQIMGSWCPNCMDETAFFRSIYPAMQSRHVEMISLAFESADSSKAIELLSRYKKNMNVPWDILYAGPSRKSEAVKRVPRLEHVMSYPTTLFLRPDHTVYKVHTGFFGPGTGEVFHRQSREMAAIIKELQAMYRASLLDKESLK